ncbi:MAG: metallophosphoesterase [Pseudomonadota bacterium]
MSRPKIKLAVSDFHLGKGAFLPNGNRNYLEDFFYDQRFVEFLEYYSSDKYEKADVELVICGDFFNQLQVDPLEINPQIITERVALARTGAIMHGHVKVFEALKFFAAKPNHKITFLIGNHDIGLLWPSVRHLVEERIGGQTKVYTEPRYIVDQVCFEHGNQHCAENWIDFEHPFLKGNNEPIINLPWGDLFVIHFLNKVKRARPYADKVFPFKLYFRWALFHDTRFALSVAAQGISYFFKVLFKIGDHNRFSLKKTYKIVKEFSFPIKMDKAAKKVLNEHPECKVVVFGHGHRPAARLFQDGREYFNIGIWNEMINLDIGTMGRLLRLTFVEINYDKEGTPHGMLREWKGKYREVEEMVLV